MRPSTTRGLLWLPARGAPLAAGPLIAAIVAFAAGLVLAAAPLPSWNDNRAKHAILAYVDETTTEGSPGFIPPAERIAVFDNDGTLWPENPLPFQLAFALDSLKRQLEKKPAWRDDPMVKAALGGDFAALLADEHKGLLRILALTHAGMTTDEFSARVNDWLKSARHPRYDRPYDACVYQPMLEVLSLLR